MSDPILSNEGFKVFIAKMSTLVTNDGSRGAKTSENVILQETHNHLGMGKAIASNHLDT